MSFKLILPDFLVVLAIILFLSCHLITNYVLNSYRTVAEMIGEAKEIAYAFEANPIAKFMFKINAFRLIYSYVIVPGLIAGFYYMIRKNTTIQSTTTFALAIFVMALCNFLNDFSVLLGILAVR